MFSYGGQNDDELCFETGDIITLISKVGCLNNQTWKYRFSLEMPPCFGGTHSKSALLKTDEADKRSG